MAICTLDRVCIHPCNNVKSKQYNTVINTSFSQSFHRVKVKEQPQGDGRHGGNRSVGFEHHDFGHE